MLSICSSSSLKKVKLESLKCSFSHAIEGQNIAGLHCHAIKNEHRHAERARVIFLCVIVVQNCLHWSNDLVKFFCCNVQHKRDWEFMMYIRCYIGNGKIAK